MSVGKCKTMVINDRTDEREIKIGGSAVEVVEDCYLGSYVANSMNCQCDKDCQIRTGIMESK